jgi:hypothetical protein
MDLEQIQRMWEKDSVIDDVMLDEASLKIPQLHAKYLTIYNDFKLLKTKAEFELKKIKHKRWLYYTGKEVPEDEEPFQYKIMKSDIQNWITVDETVIRTETKIQYYETVIYNLSEILKQINNRNFMIKSAIDWRRFTSGV